MAVEVAATRRRFTRAEYYRMAEVGILGRRDRVELIRGEIVEMSPIGRRHQAFIDNLSRLLILRLADDAIVSVHGPLALADDTEPEPDLVVLRRRDVPYKEREAWAEDALLVIEVAESSLAYDRSTKMRLYAEVGIPEYWVVDCAAETVEVHRGPGPDGYRDVSQVAGGAMLTLQAFPGVELTPADIFA
jgi:Uma2 family endonuclease